MAQATFRVMVVWACLWSNLGTLQIKEGIRFPITTIFSFPKGQGESEGEHVRSLRSWTKMRIVHRIGEWIAALAGTKCPLGFVIVIPLGFGSTTAEVTGGKGDAGSSHGRGVR